MEAVDVHQHLWPDAVLAVLERRAEEPFARWRERRWEIRLAGEAGFSVDPLDHRPSRRAAGLSEHGLDRAIVALSAPVGIAVLPAAEALEGVGAWHEAADDLPPALGWWASVPSMISLDEQVEVACAAFRRGASGLCLPAARLDSPATASATLPLLEACGEAGLPLFVHPGPASGVVGAPSWWAPATDYVAAQHVAWHAFHAAVRPELPTLRVIFALLAGLAPLHAERTLGRGGIAIEGALADPLSFYDVSSYGPRAVRAMVCAVGLGQLVHGSDDPVAAGAADPVAEAFGRGRADVVRRDGPSRALGTGWVPA